MNDQDTRSAVIRVLGTIVPEAESETIDPSRPVRDQVEMDSMDALNFMIALHKEFGVEIPERDYAKLVTLSDITGYLSKAALG